MNIVLVFPHQLFEHNNCLEKIKKEKDFVFLVEDYLYFREFKFHKQKLLLHRASMKCYEKQLLDLGFQVNYIESEKLQNRKSLGKVLDSYKVKKVFCYSIVDNWLEKDLTEASKKYNFEIEFLDTPMFINSSKENIDFFEVKNKGKRPFMKTFYEWQRKRLKILMDENGKPVGDKYSFDAENRKKLPKNYHEPENVLWEKAFGKDNSNKDYISKAALYVQKEFKGNYGNVESFNYAINSDGAKKVLKNFLENKLDNFGTYEDAISENFNNINHSVLTPYLNIGLITPAQVIAETLLYVKDNSKNITINNLEGFIRQIIGWREFMRAMYEIHGTKMRTGNFFNHVKKLEDNWWTGETGYYPIDNTIKKVSSTAYNHHIERLMVIGNFMLLSEYAPDDVYKWFMEMYIDSYDWVMVPNVYGMSQFADGGVFATKPYISGSNYILKMSDYKKDGVWDKKWDELFWSFLKKHKEFFSKNIRFRMLLSRIK